MKKPDRRFWPFVLLSALILLTGGIAVGMAARLVVSPQKGEMVEVSASPQTYGINDQLFYPWNAYSPEEMAQLSPWSQGPDQEWYEANLRELPSILGFSGMENGVELGRTGEKVGFWMDCPVTALDGQPALLDVAYGQEDGALGMCWVARSTGALPTQAQKDAAIAQVQSDVCAWLGSLGGTCLEDTVMGLHSHLLYGTTNLSITYREEWADAALGTVLYPLKYIWEAATNPANGIDRSSFSDICGVAAGQGLQIQLAFTQRQVVLVLSPTTQGAVSPYLVGVYYDMVLEQYSGIAINAMN